MVKLNTGREIELKPLNMIQRVEIDDEISAYYFKLGVDFSDKKQVARTPFSLSISLKAIGYACKVVPDDLTNFEIIELFNQIYKESHLSELQKKS